MEKLEIVNIDIKHESYPKLLKEINNFPKNIFVKGNINYINNPAIAIVGTRKATQLGLKIANDIAYNLGLRGFTIVSGLAIGIDSAAHEGALRAKAKTIAVLGNGLNKIYPAQNENLANKILESGGAIISEHEAGAPAHKGVFLNRNRIISGLSVAVVFVEVPIKSGAINTASWAGDQGRSLFVIPGPINHPNYAGSHKLIRDGGTLVTCADDILEDLGIEIKETVQQAKKSFRNDSERLIFETIEESGGAISADEIIDATGLDTEIVNINLANLVIYKIVSETAEGYVIA